MSTHSIISSVTIEPSKKGGMRFVIGLSHPGGREFFSTPLDNDTSLRINSAQIRNAFPELAGEADPIKAMLRKRSTFIGREVLSESVPQLDKTGKPKLDPESGKPYMNVRLLPSSQDLSDADIEALFSGVQTGQSLKDAVASL